MARDERTPRPTRQRKKRRIDTMSSALSPSSPIISSAESSSSEKEPASSRPLKSQTEPNVASKSVASQLSDATRSTSTSSSPSSEVSSDSSSDTPSAESEDATTNADEESSKPSLTTHVASQPRAQSPSKAAPRERPKTAAQKRQIEFESWYMKALTAQYGDDLDKVRQAQDFKASSVPMLIKAMKQGADVFSEKEREVILNGVR